jgi:hypothetical protein
VLLQVMLPRFWRAKRAEGKDAGSLGIRQYRGD